MKYLVILLLLAGCKDPTNPEFKCQDGTLYIESNGAWIQAIAYKDNKCLPAEVDK